MRKTVVVLFLVLAGMIPLLWYHPGRTSVLASPPVATGLAPSTDPTPSFGPSPLAGPTPSAGPAPPTGSGGATGTKTVDGPVVDSDFGPYQIRATFTDGRLTDVQIITTPSDRHSQLIAEEAAPILREEALRAQSAHIDTVSGATVTTEAYTQSLQAAIDAKGS